MIDKACGKEEPGGCDTSIKEDVPIALLGDVEFPIRSTMMVAKGEV
jgi:hypothetical protein